jgi:hypothetical protein
MRLCDNATVDEKLNKSEDSKMTTDSVPPKPCPECGGDRTWYNVGPEFAANDPDAAQAFDNQRHFRMALCGQCGHAAFFLIDPARPPIRSAKKR